MKRDRFESLEFYALVCAISCVLFVQVILAARQTAQERRIVALQEKPCILTGAHTGCERIGAR